MFAAPKHYFTVPIAEKYGVDKAIVIEYINHWVTENEQNHNNYRDGNHWVYFSARELSERQPYFSKQKIKRMLLELEQAGAIESGNYNKMGGDRTKWYRLLPSVVQMFTVSGS